MSVGVVCYQSTHVWCGVCVCVWVGGGGWDFKNTYELLNLKALKFSPVDKIYIFQGVGKIFVRNFKGTIWNST